MKGEYVRSGANPLFLCWLLIDCERSPHRSEELLVLIGEIGQTLRGGKIQSMIFFFPWWTYR